MFARRKCDASLQKQWKRENIFAKKKNNSCSRFSLQLGLVDNLKLKIEFQMDLFDCILRARACVSFEVKTISIITVYGVFFLSGIPK